MEAPSDMSLFRQGTSVLRSHVVRSSSLAVIPIADIVDLHNFVCHANNVTAVTLDENTDGTSLARLQSRIEFEWMFVVGFFVVGFHMDGVEIISFE